MTITASMVRELREATGAPMMKCKQALEEAGGEMDAAFDFLRKQGLKSAEKKMGRETGEGQVIAVLSEDGRRGHLVGIACETDFLRGTDRFQALVTGLEASVRASDPDGLDGGERPLVSCPFEGGDGTVADAVQAAIADLGENMKLVDCRRFESPEGFVGAYVHHDKKQAAMAAVNSSADGAKAGATIKSLCQHVVVFQPAYLTQAEVPAEEVERERAVLLESEEMQSKPEDIRPKIVEGRLKKFFAARCLEDQPWIHDDKQTVAQAIAGELDGGTIAGFARVAIGG